MDRMYATHPKLVRMVPSADSAPGEPAEPADAENVAQPGRSAGADGGTTESGVQTVAEKRSSRARELLAREIDEQLRADVEKALDDADLTGDDRNRARLGVRSKLLGDRWKRLQPVERGMYEARCNDYRKALDKM